MVLNGGPILGNHSNGNFLFVSGLLDPQLSDLLELFEVVVIGPDLGEVLECEFVVEIGGLEHQSIEEELLIPSELRLRDIFAAVNGHDHFAEGMGLH